MREIGGFLKPKAARFKGRLFLSPMDWRRRWGLILTIGLLAVEPLAAQKIKVSVDKSADFGHYRRYAWGKNYLMTHQSPTDQKAIGDELRSSIDRQLKAKSFSPDETNPDFEISYEAGGLSKADISTTPDLSRDIGNPNAINQPADIGPIPTATDAWLSVLGGLRVTVVDEKSKKKVWVGQISKKIRDPRKFLLNLDSEVDGATTKLLKSFPPDSK